MAWTILLVSVSGAATRGGAESILITCFSQESWEFGYLGSEGQSDDSNCRGVSNINKDMVLYRAIALKYMQE